MHERMSWPIGLPCSFCLFPDTERRSCCSSGGSVGRPVVGNAGSANGIGNIDVRSRLTASLFGMWLGSHTHSISYVFLRLATVKAEPILSDDTRIRIPFAPIFFMAQSTVSPQCRQVLGLSHRTSSVNNSRPLHQKSFRVLSLCPRNWSGILSHSLPRTMT